MTQFVAHQFAQALWGVVKSALMVTGVVALVAWQVNAVSHIRTAPPTPVQADALPVLDAVQPARLASETRALASETAAPAPAHNAEHQRIATYLARKYKVAADATQWIVNAAFLAGRDVGVDPLLILAVMAIESRMNPFAESGMGAVGLMQVIPRFHLDKFEELGGRDAVLNPVANIRVGALILKDYLRKFGDAESGLRAYSGATTDDFGYAAKVLAERDRLKAAGDARKASPLATPATVRPEPRRIRFEAPEADGV